MDDTDIDLLFATIRSGGGDLHYDVDGSETVSVTDLTFLVSTLLATDFGDTNLDQDVDTVGLIVAITNFTGTKNTNALGMLPEIHLIIVAAAGPLASDNRILPDLSFTSQSSDQDQRSAESPMAAAEIFAKCTDRRHTGCPPVDLADLDDLFSKLGSDNRRREALLADGVLPGVAQVTVDLVA